MKILGIILVIFEFLLEKPKVFYKKHNYCIKRVSGITGLFLILIVVINYFMEPDNSVIKKDYLIKHNLSHSVKCYQTDNGIRTKNFRLYKGNEYRIVNVIYDKWDIYPKGSNKNGFYLGKCDILEKEIENGK